MRDTVSLRDLPATIVDLIGLGIGAPFPGRSLARQWRNPSAGSAGAVSDIAISELASPNPLEFSLISSPVARGSLVSIADGDFVYIRNEGTGTEELFNQLATIPVS